MSPLSHAIPKFLSNPQYAVERHVRLSHSVNIALPIGSTILDWDTAIRDTENMHDPAGLSTRITFSHRGWYMFGAGVRFAANTSGHYRLIDIRLNGITVIARKWAALGGMFTPLEEICMGSRYFSDGDYIEVIAIHNATVTLNSEGFVDRVPLFWAARIHAP